MLEKSRIRKRKKYCSSKGSVNTRSAFGEDPGMTGGQQISSDQRYFCVRGPSTLGREWWDAVSIPGLKYDRCKGARDVKLV